MAPAAVSQVSGRAGDDVLHDLVAGEPSPLTTLPWVGHRSRNWEPEPLRWLGIRGMNALMASADERESKTCRPARRAQLLDRLTGSH